MAYKPQILSQAVHASQSFLSLISYCMLQSGCVYITDHTEYTCRVTAVYKSSAYGYNRQQTESGNEETPQY